MSGHSWGDDWFKRNGDDLYAAEKWIHEYVKYHSFCTLLSKEKYGTIRYEYIFPPHGGIFCQWSRFDKLWFWWVNSVIHRAWEKFGWLTTRRAVFKAIKKWPHLEDELLEDLASNEDLVGSTIHDRYWTRCYPQDSDE